MSVFNQIINGNGYPQISWVAIRYTGNTIAKEVFTAPNYTTALAMKLQHKHRQQITLELCGFDLDGHRPQHIFGDESDWLTLKENLKTLT